MKITYFGHACFIIEIKNKTLVFDPFISENPLSKDIIDVKSIKADYVFISHGHSDHMLDGKELLKNNNATLITNNEIAGIFSKYGINAHPFNIGGKHKFDFGTVRYVNAIHSSVMPDGTYAGNPGGFLIHTDEMNFYFAGDTALTMDMKLIGDYYKTDLAFLPIGDNFTMDIEDAIIASDFIKCNKIIGMHYNTWPIINIDTEKAKQKFSDAGKDLILLNINETSLL